MTSPAALTLRDCRPEDDDAVQAIYAHYVRHSLATFEETVPTLEEMTRRRCAIENVGNPFIVAEVDGRVAGYAYAGPFRARSAYRYTLENSIYVSPNATGKGLGKALLKVLIGRCQTQGCRQMLAVIGDSDNQASIRLHGKFGFERVGLLKSVGFKFDRWVDAVIMQRQLGEGDGAKP
ncbi:GNAT family N-acetyltransferase [Varunaivibrio sulfuroxidans]|uniref:Phosphinothricin acetyltransferase n=1 Tax=Varunaivibrio sulfuroxidans TaxID=1773489 RepID=A0A4R3J6E5_9PROT|nr:GNAT family N-acetyltransferase [Varunaivibrio sulfuroxidans]TCS60932.1 phosphinothricin acetyltransferase [Varunaivibrio sulfuroxidans]WES31660.1 GNAT family N-acetyltransferase [Varunaivibrio sulfuroxidans]